MGYDFRCDRILGWCEDCKETVELICEESIDVLDGGFYITGRRLCCPNDSEHVVVGIMQCPICGNDMGENDAFCEDCYETVRLSLNALKDELHCSQDDFEDIIANHFGW